MRLAVGLGIVALVALASFLTVTGVGAQAIAPFFGQAMLTCPTTGTPGVTTNTGTTACTINPGGTYMLTTEHVFASPPAGISSNIQRAWQLHQRNGTDSRWPLHPAGSHWFYLWAENVNAATGTGAANTAFFYYAPPRRTAVSIPTAATGCDNTGATCAASAAAGSAVPATIYAQAGNVAPIADVTALTFTSAAAVATAPTFVSAQLASTLMWGHAQEWWAGGTVGFNAKSDQFAPAGSTTGLSSGWNATGVTLTLSNSAPTNAVSGGGSRVVAANASAPFIVTVADANGDVRKVRLLLRRTTGATWFGVAAVPAENDRDTIDSTTGNEEYQSDTEAYQSLPIGTGLFTTYLGQNTTTGTNSSVSVTSGGGVNSTSITYTFNLVPTTNARGTWNVYAQSVDFHGGDTGPVLVGTLTVT